ncbi:MAG: hypothetical protein ACOZNI_09030 [Myxococcota bacterium]
MTMDVVGVPDGGAASRADDGSNRGAELLIGQAWKAWELGDGEGLLALLAQARALGPLDLATLAWMEEAETVAREQADITRYQRARRLLAEGDLANGLRTWLDLSASARAAIRQAFDLPEFRWLEEMDAGKLDATIALGQGRAALARDNVAGARALLEPHRRMLSMTEDGRAALATVDSAPRPLPPPKPAAPASPDDIAALASHLAAGGNFKVPATAPDWPLTLALALRDLLPGKDGEGDLERIEAVVDRRDAWKGLPPPVAVRLLELVAARLRMLQAAGLSDRRIDLAFSTISTWSKREKPGFAYGLSREHRPRTGSWEGDADAAVDELYDALPSTEPAPKVGKRLVALEALVTEFGIVSEELRVAVAAQIRAEVSALLADGLSARNTRLLNVVAPVADELTGADMRALRRAARAAAAAAATEPETDEESDSPIPDDWAWWSVTRGKRAVMVGGDPREPNRVRLEAVFGFAELAWEPAEFSRNSLQKVRDRVKARGVDLVLILTRFVGHDADQVILPACKDTGVPFVPVKSGYGVAGMRRAIERYVAPHPHQRDGLVAPG